MVLHRRVNLMLAASDIDNMPSRKLLRIEITPDSHLTYNENGGNRELVLNIADKYIPLVKCKAYFNCVSYFLPFHFLKPVINRSLPTLMSTE